MEDDEKGRDEKMDENVGTYVGTYSGMKLSRSALDGRR
jgi:hypothetical protein